MNFKAAIRPLALVALAAAGLSPVAVATPAMATGAWTMCATEYNGEWWSVPSARTRDECFSKMRRCLNDPNAPVTFYNNPVVIYAPFRQCNN